MLETRGEVINFVRRKGVRLEQVTPDFVTAHQARGASLIDLLIHPYKRDAWSK
jgi:hypothetical protein